MIIKEARQSKSITQTELSKITGVPTRTLQGWEAGDRKPPAYVEELILNRISSYKTPAELEAERNFRASYVEKGRLCGYEYKQAYLEMDRGDELKRLRHNMIQSLQYSDWQKILDKAMLMSQVINTSQFFDNIYDLLGSSLEKGAEINENLEAYLLSFLNALGEKTL